MVEILVEMTIFSVLPVRSHRKTIFVAAGFRAALTMIIGSAKSQNEGTWHTLSDGL